MNKDEVKISRFISLVLRHKPEVISLNIDKHGWASVDELIEKVSKWYPQMNKELLDYIVENNNKKRFSYNEDQSQIRANQGHSINVDVDLEERIPPDVLYHGTAFQNIDSIMEKGIVKGNRLYVHLSQDEKTAINVGKRHGLPIVLIINTKEMVEDGIVFYYSVNGIWLTEYISPKYIQVL